MSVYTATSTISPKNNRNVEPINRMGLIMPWPWGFGNCLIRLITKKWLVKTGWLAKSPKSQANAPFLIASEHGFGYVAA